MFLRCLFTDIEYIIAARNIEMPVDYLQTVQMSLAVIDREVVRVLMET